MTFTIPYPKTKAAMSTFCKRFGLNAIYAGKHWTKRREDAEYWHLTVKAELMRQNVPYRAYDNPVSISFWWNDRLDIDNHALIGKYILDSLKGYLIHDDDRRFVKEVHHKFYDGDCITVEVTPI